MYKHAASASVFDKIYVQIGTAEQIGYFYEHRDGSKCVYINNNQNTGRYKRYDFGSRGVEYILIGSIIEYSFLT